MNGRKHLEPTLTGRLAAAVRELIIRMYCEEKRRNPNVTFPNVPDNADIKEAIDNHFRLEDLRSRFKVLQARLEEVQRSEGETKRLASMQRALEIVNEMEQLKALIKAEEKAQDSL